MAVTASIPLVDRASSRISGSPARTGISSYSPIVGTEKGTELTRVLINNETVLDYEAAEKDMLQAAEELLRRHPEIKIKPSWRRRCK